MYLHAHIFPTMSRPPFSLSDDQARLLAVKVAGLEATCPRDPRNHRPFVRGFLRAVFDVTGSLFSPTIYHRLLAAYAPERRPSTATLAAEKQSLAAETAIHASAIAPMTNDVSGLPALENMGQLHALLTDAVDASLVKAARMAGHGVSSQVEFYAARLREAEAELAALRAERSELAAELAVVRQSAQQHALAAEREAAAVSRQTQAVLDLTREVGDSRRFAMQAIDEARSEARIWKERAGYLETQRQHDARLMETFRQAAYQRGCPIPEQLKQDKPQ